MKLLIAEDDLTSRIMLEAVARKWGYLPIAVEDGEAAWQVLQDEEPPRLLLLDWEMPGIDGLTLCQRIREQQNDDPPFIILLTARSDTDDIVEGLDKGANDYIAKPFENAELQARLQVGKRMLDLQAELAQAREALAYQAMHDPLTGLMNRRASMSILKKEIARAQRQKHNLSIGMCDIDYFKRINDTHGHVVGDVVLKEAAQRMLSTLRPYDHIGRYGGEEFLVVLSTDNGQELRPFERIRQAIAEVPFDTGQDSLNITISCGVTCIKPGDDKRDDVALITAADAALYEAKAAGRNCTILS